MNNELEPNTVLSHYRILQKIGAGGMGEVYLAEDTKLDRRVALKVLPADVAANEDRMRRFVQEAKAASALNHPNILTIYEIGDLNVGHFIASEFIDGETLRQRMRRGRMPLDDVLDVATQIASALAAAYAAGLAHRDIKPENVILRHDGIVKLLDFGLAKLSEPAAGHSLDAEAPTLANVKTEPGRMVGTVAYMSPEQARGRHLDGRSDIWSLGIVLYEMVARRKPFKGETPSHVTIAILEREPPPLARFAADVPSELERITRKCLMKDRDQRYQTPRDLLIDLKNLRREVDLRSELHRTGTPPRTEASAIADDSPTQTLARTLSTPSHDVGPRQTSSIEYVVTEIKRHKKSAILIAAVAVAIATSAFFVFHSRGTRTLTEKDTVLLTDFVNTTGDAVFDGTLKQALAVQLGQSPFLNIFSEDRVRAALKFMGRPVDERVSRDVGREICQRQGFKAMLVGSIGTLGNQYVITVEAVNAQNGDAIAREQRQTETKEQVLRALGEVATKLREELGESLASIQKFDAPIEQGTTSSLEAFKAFSLGFEQQLKGKYFEAIPLYKRAVEIDPNFALAYARLASVYTNSGAFALAAEASQKAYDLRDRVSERERLYSSMSYYGNVTKELEKYIETLELWARTYPRDVVPHNNLALQYNDIGQYEKAVEEAQEAIRLNPNAAPPHSNLARALSGLNRFDDAKDVIKRAQAQNVESLFMHRILYSIAFIQADEAGMKQQIDWTNGKPEEYTAQQWQTETAAFSGQLRNAKEFSSRAVELAQRRDLKEVVAQIVAGDAVRDSLFADCKQVKEKTTNALAVTESQPAKISAANALAACGQFGEMQAITEALVKSYPKDTLLNKLFLPLIQARAEMYRGNSSQVIQLLETTRPYEGAATFQVAFLRGQAYLSQRKGTEAATEFQKIIDHRGWQPTSPLYPLAYFELAHAAVLSGDTTKARKAYESFFAFWKDADADIPILQRAKREYENLK